MNTNKLKNLVSNCQAVNGKCEYCRRNGVCKAYNELKKVQEIEAKTQVKQYQWEFKNEKNSN